MYVNLKFDIGIRNLSKETLNWYFIEILIEGCIEPKINIDNLII